ncbi:MAG: hypothetical protein ACJZ8O_11205 [Pirellulaceae bacterium]
MNRKDFLAITAFALLGGRSSRAADKPSLYEQLRLGLRVQRPQDLGIIKKVVQLTESGRLPYSMVVGTFQWARKKHAKYPFPYFYKALQIRAKKIGVDV